MKQCLVTMLVHFYVVLRREDQARWRSWHMLCSQLTYVVGEVLRFSSIDVLEPLWGELEARLLQAGNMDEVRSQMFCVCL